MEIKETYFGVEFDRMFPTIYQANLVKADLVPLHLFKKSNCVILTVDTEKEIVTAIYGGGYNNTTMSKEAEECALSWLPSKKFVVDKRDGYVIYDYENDQVYFENLRPNTYSSFDDHIVFSGDGRKIRFGVYGNSAASLIILNRIHSLFRGKAPTKEVVELFTAEFCNEFNTTITQNQINYIMEYNHGVEMNKDLERNEKHFYNKYYLERLHNFGKKIAKKKPLQINLSMVVGDPFFTKDVSLNFKVIQDVVLPEGIKAIYISNGKLIFITSPSCALNETNVEGYVRIPLDAIKFVRQQEKKGDVILC